MSNDDSRIIHKWTDWKYNTVWSSEYDARRIVNQLSGMIQYNVPRIWLLSIQIVLKNYITLLNVSRTKRWPVNSNQLTSQKCGTNAFTEYLTKDYRSFDHRLCTVNTWLCRVGRVWMCMGGYIILYPSHINISSSTQSQKYTMSLLTLLILCGGLGVAHLPY